MEKMYHGSNTLFDHFDLSHALEGNGKVKFGYGVYVTSSINSATHYALVNKEANDFYVYTICVPELKEDNHIAFKQAVHPAIIQRTEEKLNITIPEKEKQDGKNQWRRKGDCRKESSGIFKREVSSLWERRQISIRYTKK